MNKMHSGIQEIYMINMEFYGPVNRFKVMLSWSVN